MRREGTGKLIADAMKQHSNPLSNGYAIIIDTLPAMEGGLVSYVLGLQSDAYDTVRELSWFGNQPSSCRTISARKRPTHRPFRRMQHTWAAQPSIRFSFHGANADILSLKDNSYLNNCVSTTVYRICLIAYE